VVRGTPLVSEGEGGSDSIAPSTRRRFYSISEMGPATSQMGTHISVIGTLLAEGTHVHRTGIPPPFRCDLKGE
jgi:hypothetical protein